MWRQKREAEEAEHGQALREDREACEDVCGHGPAQSKPKTTCIPLSG
jgi:hypothetical protein